MKNNRLVVFAYDFPPSSGGIARLCYEIALGQNKNFKQIIVLTRKKLGRHKPLKKPCFKIIYLPESRVKCELKALKILKTFDKNSTTIITGLWYPEAFLALLSGHKNIYSLAHGAELLPGNSSFRKIFWLPVFARLILKKINAVIANSNYTSALVKNLSPKAKSVALPLGVDTNQFQPLKSNVNDGMLHISTLSRVHQFKGYDQIFDAICGLDKDLQEKIIWHIGGTGPYLEKFKLKVKVNKKYFKVFFHGFIPDEELIRFYNKSNLFVLFTQNSKSLINVEGFGLVFLESQACGIPVIGTNTGGIPDAIEDGNGGWLLDPTNIVGLRELLVKILENPKLLYFEGKRARMRTIKECTWDIYSKELFEILMSN